MQKLAVFTTDQLRPVVQQGSAAYPNTAVWIQTLLKSIAGQVKADHSAYLQYGPFWWPVKAMMQDSGLIGGEPVDPDKVAQVTMGEPALDCAAAWAFSDHYQGGDTFTVETEDGDTIDYVLADEDFSV